MNKTYQNIQSAQNDNVCLYAYIYIYIGVRGSPERRIFSRVREGEGVCHREFPSRFFFFFFRRLFFFRRFLFAVFRRFSRFPTHFDCFHAFSRMVAVKKLVVGFLLSTTGPPSG